MSFAGQIKAFRVAVEKEYLGTLDRAVNEVLQRLRDRSPVDTGNFKSNWERRDEAKRIIIENLTPYGLALELGHSRQAPHGMVRITAEDWPSIVAESVRNDHRFLVINFF